MSQDYLCGDISFGINIRVVLLYNKTENFFRSVTARYHFAARLFKMDKLEQTSILTIIG